MCAYFIFTTLTYLACCGPTLPISCAVLAVIWKSAMAPDSIPKGCLHCAEIRWEKKHNERGKERKRNKLKRDEKIRNVNKIINNHMKNMYF